MDVTPTGIRDGEPDALAALVQLRAGAVLAYAERVTAPGQAGSAAAEAFARFRAAVVAADELTTLDADALLLRATRTAAAARGVRATRFADPAMVAGAHDCVRAEQLLVPWLDEELPHAELANFEAHVADCPDCVAALSRFERAERAYERPPKAPVPPGIARSIVDALAAAAPVAAHGGDEAGVRAATELLIFGSRPPATGGERPPERRPPPPARAASSSRSARAESREPPAAARPTRIQRFVKPTDAVPSVSKQQRSTSPVKANTKRSVTAPPPAAAPRDRTKPADRMPSSPAGGRRVALPSERVKRIGPLVFGAIALLALGAAGYAAGKGGEQTASPPAQLAQQASRSGVELRSPAGWTQRPRATTIPGLDFTPPLVLSPGGRDDAGIVAGVVKDATGSDLLPSALRRRLPASAAAPRPVLLGTIQALRYRRISVDGFAGALTLFAVPTADGSVIVACHDARGSAALLALCERSAATLRLDGLPAMRLDGQRSLPVGPSRSYGRRVASAIRDLERALTRDGRRLREARRARAQARSADAIASTFSRVAGRLDPGTVSSRDAEGHAELVAAIRAGASAYGRLASAGRAGDRAGYRRAGAAVRAADARLRQALGALETLGYKS